MNTETNTKKNTFTRSAKDTYISGEKMNISLVISFYFMFWCSSPILNRLNIVNKQHSEDLRLHSVTS